MTRSHIALTFFLATATCWSYAQIPAKYANPDSPQVNAAAHDALAHAKILDIIGVSSGIQGVLQDLGAKVTATEGRIDLAADVLFDFDKYTLKPGAADTLCKVGEVART